MTKAKTTDEKYQTFAEVYVNTGVGEQAAKKAGYKGKGSSLRVTASRLLKNPKVMAKISDVRDALKNPVQAELDDIHIDTQAKRQALWRIQQDCSRVVRNEEVIDEYVDSDGRDVKTIRVIESVFKPKEAIEAIGMLNEMDGDTMPKGAGGGKGAPLGGGFTIEQAIIQLQQG